MPRSTALRDDRGRGRDGSPIRPRRIEVPDEPFTHLHRREAATVWPERRTAADTSPRVLLAITEELRVNVGPLRPPAVPEPRR